MLASSFGYFQGKRGLRQRDPISPVIFTLCMEYLTRMINYATIHWPFQYHPLCKGLKMNHLMFADGLLMFCKGNAHSIMLLIRAFGLFSKASGLSMNNSKSEVYFNEVSQDLKYDIQQATGFVEVSLLSPNVSLGELKQSVETFSGMEALINTGFPSLLGRELQCQKNEECLGIKQADSWNVAAVAKLVDWIYCKADTPPADAAWYWKNICKVKEKMKQAYNNGVWVPDVKGYSVSSGYEWLRLKQPKQDWYKVIWNSWNIPKHTFISRIAQNNRFQVRDKLFRIGYFQEYCCCICESEPETRDHLFFNCPYSKNILALIEEWCGFNIVGFMTSAGPIIAGRKTQVQCLIWTTFQYHIWSQRNGARVNTVLLRPGVVAELIKEEAKHRIRYKSGPVVPQMDITWLLKMGVQYS
ncbi:uncharacterized protein LOC141649242 [Silene latifolia]|uniref:uncharacterized protein LOC141649242 n=1 Tax=Silene latifolia TaxID=37657 RepID=UPI003D77A65F